MNTDYTIIPARSEDLPRLQAIELAAAALLRGHAPEAVLSETTAEAEFNAAQRAGLLWVALAAGHAIGFALLESLDPGHIHLKEIDVHPDHGRRGVGARLVAAVCAWARRAGYEQMTLTTFRDVPWNGPFYARMGFEVVPAGELDAQLTGIIEDEVRRGLDPKRRVAMRRVLIEPSIGRSGGGIVPSDRPGLRHS